MRKFICLLVVAIVPAVLFEVPDIRSARGAFKAFRERVSLRLQGYERRWQRSAAWAT